MVLPRVNRLFRFGVAFGIPPLSPHALRQYLVGSRASQVSRVRVHSFDQVVRDVHGSRHAHQHIDGNPRVPVLKSYDRATRNSRAICDLLLSQALQLPPREQVLPKTTGGPLREVVRRTFLHTSTLHNTVP